MQIRPSVRLGRVAAYPFAEIDREVERLRARGVDVIDLGVGDPRFPTPEVVREAIKRAVDEHAASGYPSYVGSNAYREAVAEWFERRFGVHLDPYAEVCATIGAKEAVFNLPNALLDPGDAVLCPNPGYPPYHRGALFAMGKVAFYPLVPENDFLPDLDALEWYMPPKTRLIWVNYPHSPSGAVPPPHFYERLLEWARRYNIVVAADECYSEIYFEQRPHSILEFGKEGVIVFQSLSKRSSMTGYRVGFVCGDRRLVGLFANLKTNIDSGVPTFVQDAAVAALRDESHVAALRKRYREARDIMVEALRRVGCEIDPPPATFYLWPRVPEGMKGMDFATMLLRVDIAVVCTPGVALCEEVDGQENPGADHVRFALVEELPRIQEAAERIVAALSC